MLFVTFHGGSSGINQVYAYATGTGSSSGENPISTNVLNLAYAAELSELRALVFANDYLYVANGRKGTSNILCFQRSAATTYNLVSTFIFSSVPSVSHPFSLAFDNNNHCWVTNQDTNVVSMFQVSSSSQGAAPAPICGYLVNLKLKGSFLDGTFVASQNGSLPNVPPAPPVSDQQGGLAVNITDDKKKKKTSKKVSNSVRDVVVSNGILFVVDEPGNCVRMYNIADGTYYGKSSGSLNSPTHLLINGSNLMVSAGNQIWSSPLTTKPVLNFQSAFSVKSTDGDISGMTVDTSGNYYIGLRTKNEIRMYNSTWGNETVLIKPSDNPEFVVYVAD
jgi:hypothetical protein